MEDDQEIKLEERKKKVREEAYYMKKAIDGANLREALHHSTSMLNELKVVDPKTPGIKVQELSPKNYYDLWMQVFDQLRVLENAFREEYRRGRRMADLYESVQYASNIIPRSYLLITAGAVYIETNEVPAKDILNDLLEMTKGVQHPLRGLFLRYYFLKMCKDKLPDDGNEYEGDGGTYKDALSVIIGNLEEMNKLWIRMQGSQKDRSKREKERIDLKVLVGENLVRLSNLQGVTLEVYTNEVLPKLLEIISNTKDAISQQYLMECIVTVFPDEYNLHNLKVILGQIPTLNQNCDIKAIYIRVMDRLADFAEENKDDIEHVAEDMDIFQLFRGSIDKIIEEQGATMELRKLLDLQVAFLNFTIKSYQKRTDYVNLILKSCVQLCEKQSSTSFDEDSLRNIVKLLTFPLETLSITILSMDEYPNLMHYLPFTKRKQVAIKICEAVVNTKYSLDDITIVSQLLSFIQPLLKEEQTYGTQEPYEFEQEQQLLARLVHLITNYYPDNVYEMLNAFKTKFSDAEEKRQIYTYPSLIYAYLRLARQLKTYEDNKGTTTKETETDEQHTQHEYKPSQIQHKTLFHLIKGLIETIAPNHAETAIKLYLSLLQSISECDPKRTLDEFSYEISESALTLYEEDISDSDTRRSIINLFITIFSSLSCFSDENYDTLVSNITQYCAKLLKKNEQCLAVLQCSHLFLNEAYRDDKKAFECFKKCLKLAQICLKSNVKNLNLYVSILNKFLICLNAGIESIHTDDIQTCIDLINEKVNEFRTSGAENVESTIRYLNNTAKYVQAKKNAGSQHLDAINIQSFA